jgi:hypothetical protein
MIRIPIKTSVPSRANTSTFLTGSSLGIAKKNLVKLLKNDISFRFMGAKLLSGKEKSRKVTTFLSVKHSILSKRRYFIRILSSEVCGTDVVQTGSAT